MNPYWGQSFFSFFPLFFYRMGLLLTGRLSLSELAPDELQIFALSLIGFSCAIVGTFLVVRKMTMLANSLSHTILVGIVIAFLVCQPFVGKEGGPLFLNLGSLLIASLFTALLTSFLTEGMVKVFKVQEDASIGLVFTSLFALGVILVTLFTRNAHIGAEIIMGNIDAVGFKDIKLLLWIFLANLLLLLLFGSRMVITSFDERFAKTVGISLALFHYLMMIQVAATSIGGFRAVGVVMILALFTAPILTARFFTNKIFPTIFLSGFISFIGALAAVASSRSLLSNFEMALSTSGLFVALLFLFFILTAMVKCIQFRRRKSHEYSLSCRLR